MMNDSFEEGPECDFCNIRIDEDESLEPLYVGEFPQPKTYHLQHNDQSDSRTDGMYLFGQKVEAYYALHRALQESSIVEVGLYDRVEEVTGTGEAVGTEQLTAVETRMREDMVSATVKITPEREERTPDAEVCEDCAEMFRSL